MRVMELSGNQQPHRVDHHVKPDLSALGLVSIGQLEAFEQAGYDATVAELADR